MKKVFKQFISIIMITAMLIPYLAPVGFAISSGSTDFGVAQVDCYPQVSYDEKTNTYTLDLELNAELYDHYQNVGENKADRGYFSANYTGWYLVELWGGNGAKGLAEKGVLPGNGGKAGYVYAKVYLEAGDILFYSLGGNGSATYVSGEGGGGNGGGNGGERVTYGVGGGGGYSALFLFDDPNYFEQTYLDKNKNFVGENILDSDRLTKYIMIAGGGGGGGSPLRGYAEFAPDGGAGGSVDNSVLTGTVTGSSTSVAGTWYAGHNGKSSGTSTAYIGQGGRETPGAVAGTAWNWATGEYPNDWKGSYNNTRVGGAGGAGNLRGGGGGGGYTGGSGGIQQSIISPTNVGGGGGGSSFIAAAVNGQAVTTKLSEKEEGLLDGHDHTMAPSSGAVSITWLPGEGTGAKFQHLPDVNVSFSLSQYFNVTGFNYSQSKKVADSPTGYNFIYTPQADGTTDVTISNISLRPSAENLTGNLKIQIKFTPKNLFAGGNDVPLLTSDGITITSNVDKNTSGTITLAPDSYHVNVPLNFEAISRTHIANGSIELSPRDMYNDAYADIRNNFAGNPMYAFIHAISEYEVVDLATSQPMADKTLIDTSTQYAVQFTVTPKNNTAINPIAGPEVRATTFSAVSDVTILALHEGHLHGQKVEFVKQLEYNVSSNAYTYTLTIEGDNSRSSHIPDPMGVADAGELHYEVPHDGIYLIQAWGGDGHAGQDAKGTFNTFAGGAGANGGYSYGYLELQAGDHIHVAKVGMLGNTPVYSGDAPIGGGGGTYTIVTLTRKGSDTTETLAIAGGGGGGGNGAVGSVLGWFGAEGKSASRNTTINTGSEPDIYVAYNGTAGGAGVTNNLVSYSGGEAGSSGQNFFLSAGLRAFDKDVFDHLTEAEFNAAVSMTNPAIANGDGYRNGAARISCLELTSHTHVTSILSNYTIELPFSDYFTVDMDTFSGINNCEKAPAEEEQLHYTSATLNDNNLLTVSGIMPYQDGESSESDGVVHYESSVDFSISVELKPKDGFLGGNDVPVLSSGGMIYQTVNDEEAHSAINLAPQADYANVKLGDITVNPLVANELILSPGDTYTREELYTWEAWQKPSGDAAWTAAFLESVDLLVLEGSDTPVLGESWQAAGENTYYNVTVGVISPGPEYATVGPQVSGILREGKASVLVQSRLIFALTGLTSDQTLGLDNGIALNANADCKVTLTPQTGYALPNSITLKYENGNSVSYIYSAESGQVTIPRSSITDSMTLTAAGTQIDYKIYYIHEETPGGQEVIHEVTYHYEDTVTAFNHQHSEVPGYTFSWRWITHSDTDDVEAYGDSLVGRKMPARDVYVIGTYKANDYTLRVTYQWIDPTLPGLPTLPEDYEGTYHFGETYSIRSATIQGYSASPVIVTGVVDEALIATAQGRVITIAVTYSPTANRLRINYIYTDTNKVDVVVYETYKTGDSYSISVPEVKGYTPDRTVITGQMNEYGVEETVYYSPNAYPVYLVIPGETSAEDTVIGIRQVFYNSIYGYTQNSNGDKVFEALPEQVNKPGNTFNGWYMLLSGEKTSVTNDTPFDLDSHLSDGKVTLYASFQTSKYLVTVEHVYLNGKISPVVKSMEVDYGTRVEITPLDNIPTGYKSYLFASQGDTGAELINGTYYVQANQFVIDRMPNHNVECTFIYIGDECQLTIHYKYGEKGQGYKEGDPAAPSYSVQLRYGDDYGPITSPTVYDRHNNALNCDKPAVSGTMNSTEGVTVTVKYYQAAPVISVTIEWGSMHFVYEQGMWNPETHDYGAGTFSVEEDANKIGIRNDSTIPITSSLSFAPDQMHSNLGGYFTAENSDTGSAIIAVNVAKGAAKDVWLWLCGTVANTLSGNVRGGQCTVTITGGD